MRTKYANNTNEEILSLADMLTALSSNDTKELVAEMSLRLQAAIDEVRQHVADRGYV